MNARLPNAQAWFVYDDAKAMAMAVAERIALLARNAIEERGVFKLALAGGETPRLCYEKLRQLDVDWPHVQIYFGDERCLPVGDEKRNDSMASDALLNHIAIPENNIHRIKAELGAKEAAARYLLVLDKMTRLDLVLLGMGEDGHTASLFPGNPATENHDAVVPVYCAPKPPAERVSLSMSTINAAREKLFMVAGVSKRCALERMLLGEILPAARVASAQWHIDRAALPDLTRSNQCR